MKLLLTIIITIISTQINLFGKTPFLTQKNQVKEIPDNRIDDDGDGLIDCMDPDCFGSESCWECETEFYQVHSNSYMVKLDPRTGVYETLAKVTGCEQINGLQFNHLDGHVYAPCIIDGEHKLGMLLQSGKVIDTGLGLPGSGIFYVGAIDKRGTMYVSNSGGIHTIDLNQENLEVKPLGIANPGVADLAYDITRDLFYGVTSSSKLKVLFPRTNEVKSYDLAGVINADRGGYGAAWSSNDGSFFVYNNSSGKIYSINVDDLTSTLILNGTGNLSINDGFNCIMADPPFETKCNNGRDDDGDGLADCDDPDCYGSNVCTVEICNNGIDDDGDGWTDCDDSECYYISTCTEICDNGIDDNGNGLVDGDDPQCGVPSGVTGGLESNRRLSDKIAKRNYNTRVLNPTNYINKQEGLIPFQTSTHKNKFDIESFVPTDIMDAYVALSSPEDLIGITNATDVVAADYYVEDRRIASFLGVETENGVYEHAKHICDRLDGSRLLDISYLHANGGNFISYELLNKHGQREYAVSFGAAFSETERIVVESHWNIYRFQSKQKYFNFQIWADSYEQLIIILESLLEKLNQEKGIQTFETSDIPQAFVMYGDYHNGILQLVIKNKNRATQLVFDASMRRHENGELENAQYTIPLSGRSEELIEIHTGYFYDLGASLNFDGTSTDEIFMADGAWGYDNQNSMAQVSEFTIETESRSASENELMVERSVRVTADVKDYLNIYRGLDAKLNRTYLNKYNTLSFIGSGAGELEITLVKQSIENWEDQYRAKVNLEEESQPYHINFKDFKSSTDEEMILDDVTMIVFTILGDNESYASKKVSLQEVSFKKMTLRKLMQPQVAKTDDISPNPVSDSAEIRVETKNSGKYEIQIINQLGQKILTQQTTLYKGPNSIKVNFSELVPGTYFYQVRNTHVLQSSGKFVKL